MCALANAIVCIVQHLDHSRLACATTAADGTYALPAPIGSEVTVSVQMGDHDDFVRSKGSQNKDSTHGRSDYVKRYNIRPIPACKYKHY